MLRKKGQSTLEYAVIIAVVVAGLLAMQMYIKRGIQGRFRQASDDIGDQFSADTTTSNFTTNINTAQKETSSNGIVTTNITTGTQSKTGSESIGTFGNEGFQ